MFRAQNLANNSPNQVLRYGSRLRWWPYFIMV